MSGFLLDTNIPSELIGARPERRVSEWHEAQADESLFLSVVTLGELRKGITILREGKRRAQLEQWFVDDLLPWFENRILPVTQAIADRWGGFDGEAQLRGAPPHTADGVIRRTRLEYQLSV